MKTQRNLSIMGLGSIAQKTSTKDSNQTKKNNKGEHKMEGTCKNCKSFIPPSSWSSLTKIPTRGPSKGKAITAWTSTCSTCGIKNFRYQYIALRENKESEKTKETNTLKVNIIGIKCTRCKNKIPTSLWTSESRKVSSGKHAGDDALVVTATCPNCKKINKEHRYKWYPDWQHTRRVHLPEKSTIRLNETDDLAIKILSDRFKISSDEIVKRLSSPEKEISLEIIKEMIDSLIKQKEK